ncbi:MAG: class I SAM-dependent methyltransferase [Myxococcota bacterium]
MPSSSPLSARLRALLKHRVLAPLLYRHPPVGLQPDRLYHWLDVLHRTKDIDGSVVEIGANLGGTAAVAAHFDRRIGAHRRYLIIDTFSGFVPEQFESDLAKGNRESNRHAFADNSPALARWVLDHNHAEHVEVVQGDIVTLDPARLAGPLSAALIDVDLADPVLDALRKVWPLLSPGGIVLVDDCPEQCDWQARAGYAAFVAEQGLPERYAFDMGIVERPKNSGTR